MHLSSISVGGGVGVGGSHLALENAAAVQCTILKHVLHTLQQHVESHRPATPGLLREATALRQSLQVGV